MTCDYCASVLQPRHAWTDSRGYQADDKCRDQLRKRVTALDLDELRAPPPEPVVPVKKSHHKPKAFFHGPELAGRRKPTCIQQIRAGTKRALGER